MHNSTHSCWTGRPQRLDCRGLRRSEHGAEVTYLGTIGTRHIDIDQLVRTLQSKAKHLVVVYEADMRLLALPVSDAKRLRLLVVAPPSFQKGG